MRIDFGDDSLFRFAADVARAEVARLLRDTASRRVAPTPAPRYDDVFYEGTKWLDSLAAPAGFPKVVILNRSECGTVEYPHALLDRLSDGGLTVTSIDNGRELATWAAGTWAEASQFGSDGFLDHSWMAR